MSGIDTELITLLTIFASVIIAVVGFISARIINDILKIKDSMSELSGRIVVLETKLEIRPDLTN